MSIWKYTGVLVLSLLIGACTPESNQQAQEALETQPDRRFIVFVDNGLEAANKGLMELEREAGETASETDTMVSQVVAQLRSEYQELSEDADSLMESTDAALDEERLNLRDRLVDLTRTVEKTRFEIIDESEEYRDTVKRRLSELDQRMYKLTSEIEEAGLTKEFNTMITRLNTLREDAAAEITELENTTGDEFAEARDDVTNALATFSARLVEVETEYETAAAEAAEDTESMTSDEVDDEVPPKGRAAVEPIDN